MLRKWYFWAVIAALLLAAAAIRFTALKADDPPAAPVVYEKQLSCGNYTAGIDFPAGVFDIRAVSGSGNVSLSTGSGILNAMLGTQEADATGSGLFKPEYPDMDMPDGSVLSVSSGLAVRIESASPVGETKKREQPLTQAVDLGAGTFVSGKDFPAGTYDIIAVSGAGAVSSDNVNDSGVNAMLGTEESGAASPGIYEPEFKNVKLPEGTTLTTIGVSVRLAPSQ